MKKYKSFISIFICLAIAVLSACSSSEAETSLRIAINGLGSEYNPFYAQSDADRNVVNQMYRSIQYVDKHNNYVNSGGGISYEFTSEGQVKYTVSIDDELYFSDGSNITIDDVIFFYHFIADATYDGYYSDWYLNDIVGLKEFYFDDSDYESAIEDIEYKIAMNYTLDTIETDDFVDYLTQTMLESSFDGSLSSKAPSGESWEKRLKKFGYSQALSDLGKNPSEEEITELVALAEAENNPNAYNPEQWYREKLLDEYITESYADNSKVEFISGIKKVNDYTCTVLFDSKNINAVGQLNALLVSKDAFGVEYIKGSAEKVKQYDGDDIGSGPYVIKKYDDTSVTMVANEYYGEDCDFSTLEFIECEKDADLAAIVNSGEFDIAQFVATAESIEKLNSENTRFFITDNNCYASLFLNTKKLDLSARKALIGLCDVNGALDSSIGSYYTKLFRPLSVRFDEYPSEITESYYSKNAYTVYNMGNTEKITEATLYYCSEDGEMLRTALDYYKDVLAQKGFELTVVEADRVQFENAVSTGKADMWAKNVYDGYSCDKYEYYNSSGKFNYTGINSAEIDALTLSVRSGIGFSDKKKMTAQLMELVMEQAAECPLYQLQTVTVYNTEKISPDNLDLLKNYDGYTYCIPLLKKK